MDSSLSFDVSSFPERLHLVTGKGGVGKSTIAMRIAMACGERKPLLIRLGEGGKTQENSIEGVRVLRVNSSDAMVQYLRRRMKIGALAKQVASSHIVSSLIEAAPGVTEVALYDLISSHLNSDADPIVVDLDSTGHALMFLDLPQVLNRFLGESTMQKDLLSLRKRMQLSEFTAVHLVTRAERVVVDETIELVSTLADAHQLSVNTLWVNRFPITELTESTVRNAPAVSANDQLMTWEWARLQRGRSELRRLLKLNLRTNVVVEES